MKETLGPCLIQRKVFVMSSNDFNVTEPPRSSSSTVTWYNSQILAVFALNMSNVISRTGWRAESTGAGMAKDICGALSSTRWISASSSAVV